VIISIEGKEVNTPGELQSLIAAHHPGDAVNLKIYRDGKTFDKSVSLRARSDEKLTASNESGSDENTPDRDRNGSGKGVSLDKIGLSVRDLSSSEKREAKVDNGVVVNDVKSLGEAYSRGITEGDIIIEADKHEISSAKDLRSVIDKHKGGDAVLLRIRKAGGATVFSAVSIPQQ